MKWLMKKVQKFELFLLTRYTMQCIIYRVRMVEVKYEATS